MYPVAPTCSIRSLSFISMFLSLSVTSQVIPGMSVCFVNFFSRANQEFLLWILILLLIVLVNLIRASHIRWDQEQEQDQDHEQEGKRMLCRI